MLKRAFWEQALKVNFFLLRLNTSPYSPLKAPLLHLAVLYKRYKGRIGDHCCSASEPAVEVVPGPNHHLCEKTAAAGWDRDVTFCGSVLCVTHNQEI